MKIRPAPQETSAGPNGGFHAWYTVGLMMAAYALSILDRTILNLMIVPIQQDLKISDTQFGLLAGLAFVLFYSFAGIPLGWLADRFCRRCIIGTGILLWSIATITCGFAGNFFQLFLARMGVGIGEAALNPPAYSLMADSFPRNQLAKAVAIFSTGSMLGAGMAFALGGALIAYLALHPDIIFPVVGHARSWQLAFILAGLPGIFLALLFLTVREPPRFLSVREPVSADRASDDGLMAFIQSRKAILIPFVVGFATLTLITYAILTWTPALLIRQHGMPAGMVGLYMGLATGISGLSGFIAGGLVADRMMSKGVSDAHMRVGVIGALGTLPCVITLSLASAQTLAIAAMMGAFFFVTMPTAAGLAGLQLITPTQYRARISAGFMVIINLVGAGLGPLVVPVITDYVFSDKMAVGRSMAVVGAIFGPVMLAAFSIARRPFSDAISATSMLSKGLSG